VNANTGFVEADGAELYFEQAGSGPPVLFIHAGVADLRMWDRQVEAFGDDFRCIRFDMRGFGRTRNAANSYSPPADIAAVLNHVDAEAVHLVGLSMGGGIAVEAALDFPDRINSVALVAAGVRGMEDVSFGEEPPPDSEVAELGEIEKAYEAEEWDRLVDLEVNYWLDGPGHAGRVQGEVREKMRQMCRGAYGRDEPAAKPVFEGTPAINRLSEIMRPALVIAGTFDERSIMQMADLFADKIPHAKKIVYEGAAHMINLEEPERFNADLREFLGGSGGVAAPRGYEPGAPGAAIPPR
jgi:3-oxoadipate enol-lactonase